MKRPSRALPWLPALIVAATACAPQPQPKVAPPQPTPRELVVLVPDPETGEVGAASVTTSQGSVTLSDARAGTSVQPGAAPAPPTQFTQDDIQHLFGQTLSAMAPAAQRFLMYFEPGSSSLNADSRATITAIVAAVRTRVAPEVSVIGHTDTTGSAANNVEVGLNRAAAVKDVLVGQGIDERGIVVSSHGESNPLIPTPDDTDEPKNRRVEVTVR